MAFSTDREVIGELGLNNCGIQIIGGVAHDRVRKDFSLLYVAKGCAYLQDKGREIPVREGQVLLFPPNCRQRYRFEGSAENLNMWVHFGGTFCDVLDGVSPRIITVSSRNEFESNLERLVRAHAGMDHIHNLLSLAYLRVVVCLLARDEDLQRDTLKTKSHMYEVLDYIHTNVGSDIDWNDCAAKCFMSRDRFNHIFRECVGLSPEQYRIRVCMERAKLLLSDFGLSVSECAEALGFHDVSYFCRRFRRAYGVSPAQFKNNQLKEQTSGYQPI